MSLQAFYKNIYKTTGWSTYSGILRFFEVLFEKYTASYKSISFVIIIDLHNLEQVVEYHLPLTSKKTSTLFWSNSQLNHKKSFHSKSTEAS